MSISEHYWHNDIALVKLAEDVPAAPDLVERIQKVTLPEQTDSLTWPEDGSECVLKGWGCTEYGKQTDGRADGRTDRRTDEGTNGQTN